MTSTPGFVEDPPNLVFDYAFAWTHAWPTVQERARPCSNVPIAYGQSAGAAISFVPGKYYNDDWNNFVLRRFAWTRSKPARPPFAATFRIAYDRINSFSFSSTVFQGMPGLTYQLTNATSGRTTSPRTHRVSCAELESARSSLTPLALRTPPAYSANALTWPIPA